MPMHLLKKFDNNQTGRNPAAPQGVCPVALAADIATASAVAKALTPRQASVNEIIVKLNRIERKIDMLEKRLVVPV
jgi:hypothetical protein